MEKNKSLFNISINYNELMNEIEAAEGILTEEQIVALEITENDLQSKSIAYLEVIKGKEAVTMLVDEEIKRLTAMKKVNNNIITRLKDNLLVAVKVFGDFEVGLTKFGTRKSQSINVEDVNSLPQQYKNVKVTESADKKALKEAIKSGIDVPGVELSNNLSLKIN
jgi:hypothetical protein